MKVLFTCWCPVFPLKMMDFQLYRLTSHLHANKSNFNLNYCSFLLPTNAFKYKTHQNQLDIEIFNPRRVGGGKGGFHRTFRNIAIAQYNAFGHRVYVNSPMSIPVSLAPFLGNLGAWFIFETDLENKYENRKFDQKSENLISDKIWIFWKFEKSTYLASK